jgi:hypothetical protein
MEIGACSTLVLKGHLIGIFIKTSRDMIQMRTTPLRRGRTDSIGYSAEAIQMPTNLYWLFRESSKTTLLGHH